MPTSPCGTQLGIWRYHAQEKQPGLCGSSPGNREGMLICQKCSNKHQRAASAMHWLWCCSLSTPNSLCVNHKHKTCTLSGKTGFQAHCYCKSSSVNTPSRVYHQCLRRCVSLTHFTQPVPLCHVMAFLCYDIIQGAHAHVRPCMFWYVRVHPLHTDADSTAERPTSSTELCWHAPTWQRGLFFFFFLFTVRGK